MGLLCKLWDFSVSYGTLGSNYAQTRFTHSEQTRTRSFDASLTLRAVPVTAAVRLRALRDLATRCELGNFPNILATLQLLLVSLAFLRRSRITLVRLGAARLDSADAEHIRGARVKS